MQTHAPGTGQGIAPGAWRRKEVHMMSPLAAARLEQWQELALWAPTELYEIADELTGRYESGCGELTTLSDRLREIADKMAELGETQWAGG